MASGFGTFALASRTRLSYLTPPPDFSKLPTNIVVPFKNILKKDSTTKQKALEEIVAYVRANQDKDIEDAVLEVWCELYPRLSVDNRRQVRELSHTIVLELLKSKKRKLMERSLIPLMGVWLAGAFDRDRIVSRVVDQGVSLACATEDKKNRLWEVCQKNIMEHAIEAMGETADTLTKMESSKESKDAKATMAAETAEAAQATYYRVVGGSLLLVVNLLTRTDIPKLEPLLVKYLNNETVWALAAAEDPFVRRSLYQLMQACIDKTPQLFKPHLPRIGRVLMTQSLKGDQSGSALELVKVLTSLTELFPEIWGTKKHPLELLRPFVEKGSQGSGRAYWTELRNLFSVLPEPKQASSLSQESAANFLKSMRKGITRREEPRDSYPHAWSCYLNALFKKTTAGFTPDTPFLQANLFPLTEQYLLPKPDLSEWASGPPASAIQFLPRSWALIVGFGDADRKYTETHRKSVDDEWQRLATAFISKLKTSLPEVSSGFHSSQQGLEDAGDRWFSLVAAMLRLTRITTESDESADHAHEFLVTILSSASHKVLNASQELLLNRDFKPYGAAAVILSALKIWPDLIGDGSFVNSLFPFDDEKVENSRLGLLVKSPSFKYLIRCLDKLAHMQPGRFETIWNRLIQIAFSTKDVEASQSLVDTLLSIPSAAVVARRREDVQTYLVLSATDCLLGKKSASWSLFEKVISTGVLNENSSNQLSSNFPELLFQDAECSLKAVRLILGKRPGFLIRDRASHVDLVTKLLKLDNPSLSDQIASIRELLDAQSSADGALVLKEAIQASLTTTDGDSASVEVLVREANSAFKLHTLSASDIMPSIQMWNKEIMLFLTETPDPSLALASRLGGAYFLVKKQPTTAGPAPSKRDKKLRALPARIALYTSELLSSTVKLSDLPAEDQVEIVHLLCLTSALADDQAASTTKAGLWDEVDREDVLAEIQQLSARTHQVLVDIAQMITRDVNWKEVDLGSDSLVPRLIKAMLEPIKDFTPRALYGAKALSNLFEILVENQGPPATLETWFEELRVMRATPQTTFSAIAFLTGFGDLLSRSKATSRLCAQMMSDMLGAIPTSEKTMYSVVLLNTCLSVYDSDKIPIENRKQVMAFKQMCSWMDAPGEISPALASETCKALYTLFPNTKTMYGPFWDQITRYCVALWETAASQPAEFRLPYLHSSFKLMHALESASDNEDITKALDDYSDSKGNALVGLLTLPWEKSNTPTRGFELVLGKAFRVSAFGSNRDVHPKLYAVFDPNKSLPRSIQVTVYSILHSVLPMLEAEFTVERLAGNTKGQLPEELLAILRDPPVFDLYTEQDLVQFPPRICSYLLAWCLVFDKYHFASQKLREDYTDSIKAEGILGPFLDFTFDVLGHSAGHPLNLEMEGLTEENVRAFDIMSMAHGSENDEKYMHGFLVHLCYVTLKRLPSLFRAWFLDCSVKQTKIAVETWVTKYLSPMIISDSLDDVARWYETRDPAEVDDSELRVKPMYSTREVTAEYPVDEDVVKISICMPSGYPLESVKVIGVNRVAVEEKKWKNWLTATQGIITFANGSIEDGIAAFESNVVGMMKNQTECAICYSIVATDKKLPDKKCGTCKNQFHGMCLYKWFETSAKNSCPLCRNPIDIVAGRRR